MVTDQTCAPAWTLRGLRPLPTSLALRGGSSKEHVEERYSWEAGERAKEGTGLLVKQGFLRTSWLRNNHLFSSL